jgi:cyclopropane fatty-acyl-phospholipid synthase-like methyltransferase
MTTIDKVGSEKSVGTREWYDFVAMVADLKPAIHAGGEESTGTLLQMLQLRASDHVLDIGCGPGGTATRIVREVGAHVTGIDASEEMIAKASARARQEGLGDKLHF